MTNETTPPVPLKANDSWFADWLAADGKGYTLSADDMRVALRARFAALATPDAANPWRSAVIEGLIANCIYDSARHDADPVLALGELIAWEWKIALDPAVSEEARGLVENGRTPDAAAMREALEYAIEAVGKEADHAMHVIRANRWVIEDIEAKETRFKNALAALPLPAPTEAGIGAGEGLSADEMACLSDPNCVHLNMLRGGIAKPSLAQIIHLYGEEAIRAALPTPAADEQRADLIERLRDAQSVFDGEDDGFAAIEEAIVLATSPRAGDDRLREREACAGIAEELAMGPDANVANKIAARIRNRTHQEQRTAALRSVDAEAGRG